MDSVCIYPDRLTVQVAGAPPFTVALDEVGLKKGGTTVVSESRLAQSNGGWRDGFVESSLKTSRIAYRVSSLAYLGP